MGTSKVAVVTKTMEEKKSIKNILKKPFQALFQKDKRKKDKVKENRDSEKTEIVRSEVKVTPVSVLLENLEKLELRRQAKLEEEDNELNNFSYHVIKDDKATAIGSQLSRESGFDETFTNSDDEEDGHKTETRGDDLAESLQNLKIGDNEAVGESIKNDQKEDSLIESLKNLKVDDKEVKTDDKKKKQVTTVRIDRGPKKKKVSDYIPSVHPYIEASNSYRHISQVNPQTLSGGNLIVNETNTLETCPELSVALTQLDRSVNDFKQYSKQEQAADFETALDFVQEKSAPTQSSTDILQHFDDTMNNLCIYPTPPRSENLPSPMSDSQIYSFPPECYLSPATSSPIYNSDNEKYQEINNESPTKFSYEKQKSYGTASDVSTILSPATSSSIYNSDNEGCSASADYPASVSEQSMNVSNLSPMCNIDHEKYQDISCEYIPIPAEKKEGSLRRNSTSMTMKQYRDMQKEIAHEFSKKLCCQVNRKSCKDIFQGYMEKLSMKDRKYLCYQVANLKLEQAYGILHHVLASLSTKEDPFQMALFSLICQKVLALKPGLFVDEFGHNLLASAVLRCRKIPLLTRYLVQCVRTVTRSETYRPANEYVFTEVNDLGDNLFIACARAGDECGDTLSELVRKEENDPPLFNIHHTNTNGYTALHACCTRPSGGAGAAHVMHVLLRHAGADLWRGDVKGGDTPLHLAVNSATCDLKVVMILFHHISIKDRKSLAHVQNRSFDTPLDYARSATKSRPNYPSEVLEFLKKCR
ncbi:uncharacterized protein LOC116778477 [Danaus plexippus]|uniref:uncharacterized protein LOC116778477 n=1 Tax=Danaus plexippus TaxID=13037 RepID=UPI002AB18C0F|nr:uncharacterized protein LOC116778477 [Danaus plexippus]